MTRVRDDRNVITDLWLIQLLVSVAGGIIGFFIGLFMPMAIKFIVAYIIGLLLNLGYSIYKIVYMYHAVQDLNVVCSKAENSYSENSWNYVLVCLVSAITLGAYMMYWYYKQGGRLHKALKVYGIESEETGVSYLLWRTVGILALGNYISLYLLIQNLNKAARAYNEGGPRKGSVSEEKKPIQVDDRGYGFNIDQNRGDNSFVPDSRNTGNKGDDPHTQKAAMLVGIKGQYAGQQIPITGNDLIVMGRDGSQANLIFRSEKISKAHCKVQFIPNENCFYVVDTSTYGVFLENGKKLEKGQITKLSRGTKIVLGGTEVFQLK